MGKSQSLWMFISVVGFGAFVTVGHKPGFPVFNETPLSRAQNPI